MSGTSVDGIDAALVEINGHGLETAVHLIAFETFPFPSGVPQRILALCYPIPGRVDDICEMNFYIGHLFAEAAKHVLQKSGMTANDIALIGSHGQTIHHLPRDSNTNPNIFPYPRPCKLVSLLSSHMKPESQQSLIFGWQIWQQADKVPP